MISSFFNKTKPINYLVLLGIVCLLLLGTNLLNEELVWSLNNISLKILALAVLLLTLYMLGEMTKSKKLTGDNSYAMLFYTLMLVCFFLAVLDAPMIFCCFFLLLSVDRALALKSEKNQKEKIFEAALWILVASLFFEWALLFLIPLYIVISLFIGKQLRLWLMPIASMGCFFILSYTGALVFNQTENYIDRYKFRLSLEFFLNPSWSSILFIGFAFLIVLLVFAKLGYRRLGRTLSLRLLFSYLVVGVLIVLFGAVERSSAIMVLYFPAAVFAANYIETVKKNRLKEFLIICAIVVPFTAFLFGAIQ